MLLEPKLLLAEHLSSTVNGMGTIWPVWAVVEVPLAEIAGGVSSCSMMGMPLISHWYHEGLPPVGSKQRRRLRIIRRLQLQSVKGYKQNNKRDVRNALSSGLPSERCDVT